MRKLYLLMLFVCFIQLVNAQLTPVQLRDYWQTNRQNITTRFDVDAGYPEIASLLFTPSQNTALTGFGDWIAKQLQLRPGTDELRSVYSSSVYSNNLRTLRLQQYFKGIKVEHGRISATASGDKVRMAQLEFYQVPSGFDTRPLLTSQKAFEQAKIYVGASTYVWDYNPNNDPERRKPDGELLIVKDMADTVVKLAFRFNMYSESPLYRAWVYVDARDGHIILADQLIKHANVFGTADTHLSGTQIITADNFANPVDPALPYRLQEIRNGQNIVTKGHFWIANDPIAKAYDFTDNDNKWTAAEHNNARKDDAALDVHFNTEVVSDYWKTVHGRNGWDDNNGLLQSYVHYTPNAASPPINNAYWTGQVMFYGDGNNGFLPWVSMDMTGHEIGHAVCQSTAGLVYRWESGAVNEGFSDIWSACVENNANQRFGLNKNPWLFGEQISPPAWNGDGIRNLRFPKLSRSFSVGPPKPQPDTYKGINWVAGDYQDCHVPNNNNDQCGVHFNSGVMARWFYLITMGDSGVNDKGYRYAVDSLGFVKTQEIAYLTEQNLTPNSGFSVVRNVSVNAAITRFGDNSQEVKAVRNAWLAVGVDSAVYNMSNTHEFSTNFFTSIGVGKNGHIWAGTSNNGLYKFDDSTWRKASGILADNNIAQIKPDKNGGIWIAQYGRTGAQAITGGVNYFPDTSFAGNQYFGFLSPNNLSSRNARSIWVDTFRVNPGNKPRVWVACLAQITAGESSKGGISVGLNDASPFFTRITDSIDAGGGTGGTQTIGGDNSEVWAFASFNYGKSQLLSYNAVTNAFIRSYDYTTVGNNILTSNFTAKAIYFDVNKRRWIGLLSNGLAVNDGAEWYSINYANVFPAGSIVTNNAIVGDKRGNVYIGTSAGLVYYNRGPLVDKNGNALPPSRIDSNGSYRLYTTKNGLPSSNIRAIAVDTLRNKLLIATDNGIVFWDQICNNTCYPAAAAPVTTAGPGNWSDPAVWSNQQVPDENAELIIQHAIVVDIDGKCKSMNIGTGGIVTVAAGKNLQIIKPDDSPVLQNAAPAIRVLK